MYKSKPIPEYLNKDNLGQKIIITGRIENIATHFSRADFILDDGIEANCQFKGGLPKKVVRSYLDNSKLTISGLLVEINKWDELELKLCEINEEVNERKNNLL